MRGSSELQNSVTGEEELQKPEQVLSPPVHGAQAWTDALPCKLVYAVLKIDLIQKQSGAQRHHLLCFLRQIITNIVSTMHTASKAKESDNSI